MDRERIKNRESRQKGETHAMLGLLASHAAQKELYVRKDRTTGGVIATSAPM